jgi:hypothetical protein
MQLCPNHIVCKSSMLPIRSLPNESEVVFGKHDIFALLCLATTSYPNSVEEEIFSYNPTQLHRLVINWTRWIRENWEWRTLAEAAASHNMVEEVAAQSDSVVM